MPWIKINNEPPKPTTLEDLGYVQVVRCKDCKHYNKDKKWCQHIMSANGDNWYCADGERS